MGRTGTGRTGVPPDRSRLGAAGTEWVLVVLVALTGLGAAALVAFTPWHVSDLAGGCLCSRSVGGTTAVVGVPPR